MRCPCTSRGWLCAAKTSLVFDGCVGWLWSCRRKVISDAPIEATGSGRMASITRWCSILPSDAVNLLQFRPWGKVEGAWERTTGIYARASMNWWCEARVAMREGSEAPASLRSDLIGSGRKADPPQIGTLMDITSESPNAGEVKEYGKNHEYAAGDNSFYRSRQTRLLVFCPKGQASHSITDLTDRWALPASGKTAFAEAFNKFMRSPSTSAVFHSLPGYHR